MNPPFVNITHTGVSNSSLLISDIDTEKNKVQPYKIPVYIPVGETIRLPLNDEVLLSYQQGSIRGFINQGLVKASLINDELAVMAWVSPDGDDDNLGTFNAPFKSIQHTYNSLVERVGDLVLKKIYLKPGIYTENIILHRNVQIIGNHHGHSYPYEHTYAHGEIAGREGTGESSLIRPLDESLPAITISPFTRESLAWYFDQGGFSYEIDEDVLTYTGPDMSEQELLWDRGFNYYEMSVTLSGVILGQPIFGGSLSNVLILGPREESEFSDRLRGVTIRATHCSGLYAYRTEGLVLDNSNFMDNFALIGSRLTSISNINKPVNLRDPDLSLVFSSYSGPIAGGDVVLPSNSEFYIEDSSTQNVLYPDGSVPVTSITLRSGHLKISSNRDLPEDKKPVGLIRCDSLILKKVAGLSVRNLNTEEIQHNSEGTLKVGALDCGGDVVVDGGGAAVFRGGYMAGNLVVGAGSAVTLYNVTIEGSISGDGTIVQNGGGYLGDNTATSYTHNTLKTT